MKYILILVMICFINFINGEIIVCPQNINSYKCLTKISIVNQTLNNSCQVSNCFEWNNEECQPTGKKQTPALVLQSIPLTGVFGAGFGNIARWDLFAISMGLSFGICIFLCCTTIGCGIFCSELSSECIKCYLNCGGCLYSLIVTIWWIYGIVLISNKEILDGNGCKLI